ncbi:MAG: polysaccharide deacetylase family protein [Paludibacteraceae bacterium]|nr:polysaccharide deacetylase family protein [Paludibacteraceae bacterium]
MLIEQIPEVFRRFLPGVIWRGDKTRKVIYLTFDDGPNPLNTPWLLDELDRLQIKATFFCIGGNVERHPDLYQEIIRRGHRVGVHGYAHVRGLFKDRKAFDEDCAKAASLIDSDLYRPPHGKLYIDQFKAMSKRYKVILWDVITRDYNPKLPPEKIYDIAVKYGRNGSIVVFHDSQKAMKNMRYAFPKAVEFWKQQGYQFETL